MLQHPLYRIQLPGDAGLVSHYVHPVVVSVVEVDVEPLDEAADLVLELVSLLEDYQEVGVELLDDPAVESRKGGKESCELT